MSLLFLLQVPFSRSELHGLTEELMHFFMYESHDLSLPRRFLKFQDWVRRSISFGMQQCDAMLKNQQLMATLRNAAFDAMLVDPMMMCGDLVADVLGLPLILSLRFSFGGVVERHCGHAPAPPSYVPAAPLPYSDHMTFVERLTNTVMYVVASVATELTWRLTLDAYYSEVKGQRGQNVVHAQKWRHKHTKQLFSLVNICVSDFLLEHRSCMEPLKGQKHPN